MLHILEQSVQLEQQFCEVGRSDLLGSTGSFGWDLQGAHLIVVFLSAILPGPNQFVLVLGFAQVNCRNAVVHLL